MTNIYDQHAAAFARVSAFVILSDGAVIGKVSIKFPADGAGRLYAYCHIIGAEMVRGYAGGFGYDKRSGAVESAFARMPLHEAPADTMAPDHHAKIAAHQARIKAALATDSGLDWSRRIEDAGYSVICAV